MHPVHSGVCYNRVIVGEHVDEIDIRPSPIAGKWYPAQPQVLRASIENWLQEAEGEAIEGRPIGVIVPHAGHRYSGPVAAHAFAYLKDLQPSIVAVLSPLHALAAGRIITSGHQAYRTPLGTVQVDLDLLQQVDDELREACGVKMIRLREDQEHSLEIELPFLQVVLGRPFKLLPIMLRDQSASTARGLAEALTKVLPAQDVLLVASSDLSHFYPQEVAHRLDGELLRRVEKFDPQAVLEAEAQGVGFACGRGAIAATLWTAQALGADRARVVNYATSGDVTHDYDSVVGYGAALITRSELQ
jgi:AmmeMemoRadiSam system protein B